MRDGDLEFRLPDLSDRQPLKSLFSEPEVKRWWIDGDYDHDNGWIVEINGEFAGWIQYEEELCEQYPSVGLDLALTTKLHGCGYGRRVLKLAIKHFVAKGHHRFTIDPNVNNKRAILCYKAAGFKPVGVMHSYERNP